MSDSSRRSVDLGSLDFDDIMGNLKEFLKTQEELKDYDFEGSVANVLLRVLAYNTHMNGFYLNMTANESHLQTADRRDSVVYEQQDIGYEPRSTKSAYATIVLELVPDSISITELTIPRFTQFTASDGVNSFVFYTTETTTIPQDDQGRFISSPITVFEGRLFNHRFIATEEEIDNGFTIPNSSVDSELVFVRVIETDTSQTPIFYTKQNSIQEYGSSSKVFWVKEVEGQKHKVTFGNGVIGKSLELGYIVDVTYFVSAGELQNGVAQIDLQDDIPDVSSYSITIVDPALGGLEIESIESIKFAAPKFYQAQKRAVTPDDYKILTIQNYSNALDVKAWGGEENEPPMYGKMFVAIRPRIGTFLSNVEKSRIIDTIYKPARVGSITPVIVDPDYIFIKVNGTVEYDPLLTSLSGGGIEDQVETKLFSYLSETISKFEEKLRYSVLLRNMDGADQSIKNSNQSIFLKKKVYPSGFNIVENYEFSFTVPIVTSTLVSGRFRYLNFNNAYIRQNPSSTSTLQIVRVGVGNVIEVLRENVGSVNQETGEVFVENIQIQDIPNIPEYRDDRTGVLYIPFEAQPTTNDLQVRYNQIIIQDRRDISVTAVS